jgi:hypothetical protein
MVGTKVFLDSVNGEPAHPTVLITALIRVRGYPSKNALLDQSIMNNKTPATP